MKFARRLFQIAGMYGLLTLVPQYFLEEKNGRDFPPAINHPEYYYGFIGVALAWQVAFLIIAQDPKRYRPLMLAAIAEKASFFLAMVSLHFSHRVGPHMLILGTIDGLLGILFTIAYAQTAKHPKAGEIR